MSPIVEFGLGGAHRQKSRKRVNEAADGYKRGCTIYVVDKGCLTHGILVLGGGVADVVADLGTTEGLGVVVDLIRLREVSTETRTRGDGHTMPSGYA